MLPSMTAHHCNAETAPCLNVHHPAVASLSLGLRVAGIANKSEKLKYSTATLSHNYIFCNFQAMHQCFIIFNSGTVMGIMINDFRSQNASQTKLAVSLTLLAVHVIKLVIVEYGRALFLSLWSIRGGGYPWDGALFGWNIKHMMETSVKTPFYCPAKFNYTQLLRPINLWRAFITANVTKVTFL